MSDCRCRWYKRLYETALENAKDGVGEEKYAPTKLLLHQDMKKQQRFPLMRLLLDCKTDALLLILNALLECGICALYPTDARIVVFYCFRKDTAYEFVKAIVDGGRYYTLTDELGTDGWSVLHWAVSNMSAPFVKLCVAAGLDVNLPTAMHDSILQILFANSTTVLVNDYERRITGQFVHPRIAKVLRILSRAGLCIPRVLCVCKLLRKRGFSSTKLMHACADAGLAFRCTSGPRYDWQTPRRDLGLTNRCCDHVADLFLDFHSDVSKRPPRAANCIDAYVALIRLGYKFAIDEIVFPERTHVDNEESLTTLLKVATAYGFSKFLFWEEYHDDCSPRGKRDIDFLYCYNEVLFTDADDEEYRAGARKGAEIVRKYQREQFSKQAFECCCALAVLPALTLLEIANHVAYIGPCMRFEDKWAVVTGIKHRFTQ